MDKIVALDRYLLSLLYHKDMNQFRQNNQENIQKFYLLLSTYTKSFISMLYPGWSNMEVSMINHFYFENLLLGFVKIVLVTQFRLLI